MANFRLVGARRYEFDLWVMIDFHVLAQLTSERFSTREKKVDITNIYFKISYISPWPG